MDFTTMLHIPPPTMDSLKLRDFARLAVWTEEERARLKKQQSQQI